MPTWEVTIAKTFKVESDTENDAREYVASQIRYDHNTFATLKDALIVAYLDNQFVCEFKTKGCQGFCRKCLEK